MKFMIDFQTDYEQTTTPRCYAHVPLTFVPMQVDWMILSVIDT
jgi:hypothetical protein